MTHARFVIEYEIAFSRDLTGRRTPSRETRATLNAAVRRAQDVLARYATGPVNKSELGGAAGFTHLEAGPAIRASIYAD